MAVHFGVLSQVGGHFVFDFQLTFFDEVLRRVAALPALVLHCAIVGRRAG